MIDEGLTHQASSRQSPLTQDKKEGKSDEDEDPATDREEDGIVET